MEHNAVYPCCECQPDGSHAIDCGDRPTIPDLPEDTGDTLVVTIIARAKLVGAKDEETKEQLDILKDIITDYLDAMSDEVPSVNVEVAITRMST